MIIQYASDLHLEFYDNALFIARNPFKAEGDILVLAGDTMPLRDFDSYKQHRFFDWCSDHYQQTFLVPGNHEYYHDDIKAYPDSWVKELRPNVRMCENKSFLVDDTEIILSTLWSLVPNKNWPAVRDGMSDFHLIRYGNHLLTQSIYNAMHERDLAFIKDSVAKSKAAHIVVVTHHVPTRHCVAPEFRNSSIGTGFTVDLTEYIETSGIDLWVYGHSHRGLECQIGNTLVVSNQIGYAAYREYIKNFSGEKCVDLKVK